MSFIHGTVSWSEPLEDVRAQVHAMLDAVGTYPWKTSDVTESDAGEPSSCVLGLQAGSAPGTTAVAASGGAGYISAGVGTGTRVRIAADLHLHDRAGLVHELGVGAPEARLLGDAELVLRAYRRWGAACGAHLLGVGAWALWDASEQRLVCWRDVAGTRPLYYHHAPRHRLVVSSDLTSVVAHPQVPELLDLAYTRALLEVGEPFQHPTRTLCAGVHKLPAAHYLVVDASGLRVRQYWQPEHAPERRYRHDDDYVEELRALVERAVTCRLPDEQHVGSHLSGGLDSSSIAALAATSAASAESRVTGFSWAPPWDVLPEVDLDERPLVEAVARFGNVPFRYTRLAPDDFLAILGRDRALQPTTTLDVEHAASRDAADLGISTLLSGWGGDEGVVFNGRGLFADLARRGRLLTVQRELRHRSEIHEGSVYRAWRGRVLLPLLPDRVVRRLWPDDPPTLPDELRPQLARALATVEPLPMSVPRERPGVRRMQLALLTNGHLQYRMESWAAHGASLGITYAFPLLDQRLLEFALGIPDHLYFKRGWKRWLYRTAMEGVLPDEVRWYPHKQDKAMGARRAQVRVEANHQYRRRLAERRESPLVDTERILAATDPDQTARTANPESGHPSITSSPAAWLAFTRLRLP